MSEERLKELKSKPYHNFFELEELACLRNEEAKRLESEEKERRRALEAERAGKKLFALKYKEGNIYQKPKDMAEAREEIWAATPTEAAEIACQIMISKERWNPTGTSITDSSSCRLDVFEGDQEQTHKPIWVNPYSIAPSQQFDGGPAAFAESALKALTGRKVNIEQGTVEFEG